MKKKQTIQRFFAGLAFIFASFAFTAPLSQPVLAATCGGVDTAILDCGGSKDAKNVEDTGIWNLLLIAINILTVGVGVAALGGIVYGAFCILQQVEAQIKLRGREKFLLMLL